MDTKVSPTRKKLRNFGEQKSNVSSDNMKNWCECLIINSDDKQSLKFISSFPSE